MKPTSFLNNIIKKARSEGRFKSHNSYALGQLKLLLFLVILFSGCGINKHSSSNIELNTLDPTVDAQYDWSFTEATKFKILGSSVKAIPLFFSCISLKPENAAPYYQLADIYLYNGDLPRALAFSKKAVSLDKNNSWYLLQLARIYREKGNIDSTIIIYRDVVKLSPSGSDVHLNLALLFLQNKEPKKAIRVLTDLKSKYGNSEEITLALFNAYSFAGDHDNCIRLLKDAILLYPDDIRFMGLLAEYYVKLNQFDRALPYYNQLLTLEPDNEKGILSLIEFYRLAKNYPQLQQVSKRYIADSAFLYQNKIEVIANLIVDEEFMSASVAHVLQLIQDMDSLYKNDFRVQTLFCDYYLRTKNYILAKEKLSYLVSNFKTTLPYWTQLIYVLNTLNQNSEIIDYCNRAVKIFGDKPFFYLYKGVALYELKKYAMAITVLQDGLKHSAGNRDLLTQFYSYLGEASNEISDYSRSDTFFRKAITLDTRNAHILNNYSYYLAQRNVDLELAAEYMEICLDIEPSSYSYLDTYGWILYKMGKLTASRKALESSLKYGGLKDKTVLEHMTVVLHASGNLVDAYKYYKLVTELGEPGDEIKLLFKD